MSTKSKAKYTLLVYQALQRYKCDRANKDQKAIKNRQNIVIESNIHDQQDSYPEVKSKPTWTLRWDGRSLCRPYSGGIADTIVPFCDEKRDESSQANSALVLDAKYYSFELFMGGMVQTSGKVHKLLSLDDVRKQYFYAQMIREFPTICIKTTRNSFVFPLSEQSKNTAVENMSNFQTLGSVKFEQSKSPITVLGVGFASLMKEYITR